MIKMMICKNCGGQFPDTLAKCPYCGTMNKKGAYRDFRRKVSAVIDRLLNLKEESYIEDDAMKEDEEIQKIVNKLNDV